MPRRRVNSYRLFEGSYFILFQSQTVQEIGEERVNLHKLLLARNTSTLQYIVLQVYCLNPYPANVENMVSS